MSVIDKLHNLSFRILTLCGFAAVISLAVNVLSALLMLAADLHRKKQNTDCQ